MANKTPVQSEGFKRQQMPKVGDRALGKPIGVRFPVEIDEVLRDMPNAQGYIREVVRAALESDGMMPDRESHRHEQASPAKRSQSAQLPAPDRD